MSPSPSVKADDAKEAKRAKSKEKRKASREKKKKEASDKADKGASCDANAKAKPKSKSKAKAGVLIVGTALTASLPQGADSLWSPFREELVSGADPISTAYFSFSGFAVEYPSDFCQEIACSSGTTLALVSSALVKGGGEVEVDMSEQRLNARQGIITDHAQ